MWLANAASPAEFRTIEHLIRDEIAILATKQPTAEELERAKRSRVMELRRLTEPTSGFGGLFVISKKPAAGGVAAVAALVEDAFRATADPVGKLENWDKPYGRGLGPLTLRLWLEALARR